MVNESPRAITRNLPGGTALSKVAAARKPWELVVKVPGPSYMRSKRRPGTWLHPSSGSYLTCTSSCMRRSCFAVRAAMRRLATPSMSVKRIAATATPARMFSHDEPRFAASVELEGILVVQLQRRVLRVLGEHAVAQRE